MASALIKPHKLPCIREESAIITARNKLSTHRGTERQHTHTHTHIHTEQHSFISYKTQKHHTSYIIRALHTLIKEVTCDLKRQTQEREIIRDVG